MILIGVFEKNHPLPGAVLDLVRLSELVPAGSGLVDGGPILAHVINECPKVYHLNAATFRVCSCFPEELRKTGYRI